jgi:hypothetical protein
MHVDISQAYNASELVTLESTEKMAGWKASTAMRKRSRRRKEEERFGYALIDTFSSQPNALFIDNPRLMGRENCAVKIFRRNTDLSLQIS